MRKPFPIGHPLFVGTSDKNHPNNNPDGGYDGDKPMPTAEDIIDGDVLTPAGQTHAARFAKVLAAVPAEKREDAPIAAPPVVEEVHHKKKHK